MAVKQVRPGPIRRLNQGGNGLRGLGGQGAVQQGARQQQNLGLRRQRQGFKQVFGALRGKDAMDSQSGPQRLLDQVRPFDSGQPAPFAAALAVGLAQWAQRPAQFLQARILLTLYNANRHRSETIQC